MRSFFSPIKFKYFFLLFLVSITEVFAQQPYWEVFDGHMYTKYYRQSCNDTTPRWNFENGTSYKCQDSLVIEETYFGLARDLIRVVLPTKGNALYLGVHYEGLAWYNGKTWLSWNTRNSPIPSDQIISIVEPDSGLIYMASSDKGLISFDGQTFKNWNTSNSPISSNMLTHIIEADSGGFYIASLDGLIYFDGDTTWKTWNTENSDIPSNYIRYIQETSSGELYLGTAGGGLVKFDMDTTWTYWNTENSNIPYNTVLQVAVADTNEIYVATNFGGLALFDGDTTWTVWTNKNSPLKDNNIECVLYSSDSILYVANNEELLMWNGLSWNSWKPESLPPLYANTIVELDSGNILVGGFNGIVSLNDSSLLNAKNAGLPYKAFCFTENSFGEIYVGMENGVFGLFNGQEWKIWYPEETGVPVSHIYSLSILKTGELLIGTYDGGLVKFDGNTSTIWNWGNSELLKTYIYHIIETSKGEVFIGTGNGIYTFNKEGALKKAFSTSATYQVIDMIEASNGEIYITTKTGLIKYDGKNWIVRNKANSNIPVENLSGIIEAEPGVFLMSGTNGLLKFDGINWTYSTISNSGYPSYYPFTSIIKRANGDFYMNADGLIKYDGENFNMFNEKNSLLKKHSTALGRLLYLKDGGLGIINGSTIVRYYPDFNEMPNYNNSITGQVFYDKNRNGRLDLGEIPLRNQKVAFSKNNLITLTDKDGNFLFKAENGSYTLHLINQEGWSSINADTTLYLEQNSHAHIKFGTFPLVDSSGLNVKLTLTSARCGFETTASIDIKNTGTKIESGKLSFILDSSIELLTSSPIIDSSSASTNTFYWNENNLAPSENRKIYLRLKMPDFSFTGHTLTSVAGFKNADGLIISDTIHRVLSCAYDPNDKQAAPAGEGSEHYTINGTPITYHIRFQNIGTDTAVNIVILDTIDSNLDMSKFKVLSSSHAMTTYYNMQGKVQFSFPEIFLPDSTVNEIESHGYVTYEVSPKDNLLENTVVKNEAYIYFDYNPAVVTNTVWNTYVSEIPDVVTGLLKSSFFEDEVNVSPNPFSDFTIITWKNQTEKNLKIKIVNSSGQVTLYEDIENSGNYTVRSKNLSPGLYLFQLSGSRSNFFYRGKLIIK